MNFSFKDLDNYISQSTNVPISSIKSEEDFFVQHKILVKKVCYIKKQCPSCGVLLETYGTRSYCSVCEEYYTKEELGNESYEISKQALRSLLCAKIGTDEKPKEMDTRLGLWRVGSYKKFSVYITDTLNKEHIDKIKTQQRKVVFATSSSISNFDNEFLLPIGRLSVENGEISLGCIDEYISESEKELKPTKPEVNRQGIMDFIRKYYYEIFYDCATNKKNIPKTSISNLHKALKDKGFKCSIRTVWNILDKMKGSPETMLDDPFYLVYGIISQRNNVALVSVAYPQKSMKFVYDSIIIDQEYAQKVNQSVKKNMGIGKRNIDSFIMKDKAENW